MHFSIIVFKMIRYYIQLMINNLDIQNLCKQIHQNWDNIKRDKKKPQRKDFISFFNIDISTQEGQEYLNSIITLPCLISNKGWFEFVDFKLKNDPINRDVDNNMTESITSPTKLLDIIVPDPIIKIESSIYDSFIFLLNKELLTCKDCKRYDNTLFLCKKIQLKTSPYTPCCHDVRPIKY